MSSQFHVYSVWSITGSISLCGSSARSALTEQPPQNLPGGRLWDLVYEYIVGGPFELGESLYTVLLERLLFERLRTAISHHKLSLIHI